MAEKSQNSNPGEQVQMKAPTATRNITKVWYGGVRLGTAKIGNAVPALAIDYQALTFRWYGWYSIFLPPHMRVKTEGFVSCAYIEGVLKRPYHPYHIDVSRCGCSSKTGTALQIGVVPSRTT
jgi:hypothetical protein